MKEFENAAEKVINDINVTKEAKEVAQKILDDIYNTRERLTEEIKKL